MLDPFDLVRKLKKTAAIYDVATPGGPARHTDLTDAVVTLDPENVPELPSTSRNNVRFFGCERVVSSEDVDLIIDFYKDAGASRFFFWLSPNSQLAEIKAWLLDRGLKQWTQTGYPTLLRRADRLDEHSTGLVVRCVDSDEASRYATDISLIYSDLRFDPIFVESCGAPGLHHFLAFDGDRAVSAGMLGIADDVGSLGWMATAEDARGKGGQSALIVERVNRAAELGCRWVVGSTLYALKSSLANMQRKGFEIVYDQEVYGFGI